MLACAHSRVQNCRQNFSDMLVALPLMHELPCEHPMIKAVENETVAHDAIAKEERLRDLFRELESVIVAYSGGVDSSYVAYVANAELGPRAVCITGQSASLPHTSALRSIAWSRSLVFDMRQSRPTSWRIPAIAPTIQIAVTSAKTSCTRNSNLSRKIVALQTSSTVRRSTILVIIALVERSAQHAVRSPLIEVGLTKSEPAS